MCGIVGIYNYKRPVTDQRTYISRCMENMRHRGPDACGTWHNNENYLAGFVRLSIRDLSEQGNQPMLSSCGNYCINFNGEIYNPDKFRSSLSSKGVIFRSTSDTEILLYGLIHFGIEKVLEEYDGIFAFAFGVNFYLRLKHGFRHLTLKAAGLALFLLLFSWNLTLAGFLQATRENELIRAVITGEREHNKAQVKLESLQGEL